MTKCKQFIRYSFLVGMLVVGLTGCNRYDDTPESEDLHESASEYEEKLNESESEENVEEYNYTEFVNDTEIVIPELEDDDISLQEAEEVVNACDKVNDEIYKFEEEYRKHKEITPENLHEYLSALLDYLYTLELEEVDTYYLNSNAYDLECLEVKFAGDMGDYIYTPVLEGYDAGGGSSQMNISTFQPFVSSYSKSLQGYMSYPDEAAEQVAQEFPLYQFDNRGTSNDSNYDNEEVSLQAVLNFSKNNVVFWHGHGGQFDGSGCVMSTGVPCTLKNMIKYYNEWTSGTLLMTTSGGKSTFDVTPKFFTDFLPEGSLSNSIIYLGTCSSGADSSLVDALIEKGAVAVFSNSGVIHTDYNLKMMKSVADGMLKKNGENYYTLEEALEYAKQENGETDTNGTYVYVTYAPGYGNLSMDWYKDYEVADRDIALVLDCSGSMEGNPIEQTKEASIKFFDTVFEQDSRVGLVSYEDIANVRCRLGRNIENLKVNLEEMQAYGSTNMYSGLEATDNMLQRSISDKKIVVLMSDGLPNNGPVGDNGEYDTPLIDYANEMKDKGYYIYTLGFFSDLYDSELVYAQNLMENIASPGLHYEVDSADNLVYFFDDIAGQISGKQYVYIRIACPVDVTVSSDGETLSSKPDSENTRTSFGTLTYEESEQEDDKVKVLRLDMSQNYDIDIAGYDSGTMDYTILYPDENGEYTDVRKFPNITVTATTNATANTALSDASYLKLDNDGDGKYEKTYKTESNGTMEEVEEKSYVVLFICLGIVVVIILIVVTIIVSRKYFKRGKVTGTIVGLFGGLEGMQYPVQVGHIYTIGRHSDCDICIYHRNAKISRHHCTIQLLPSGQYRVTDYSSNGTYNGSDNQKLPLKSPCVIPKGSLLVLGTPDNVIELR